jgi:hypothetical protein
VMVAHQPEARGAGIAGQSTWTESSPNS